MLLHSCKDWMPKVWCKSICVSIHFPPLCWYGIVFNFIVLFFRFFSSKGCFLHLFLWPSNKPFQRFGSCFLLLNMHLDLLWKGSHLLSYNKKFVFLVHSIKHRISHLLFLASCYFNCKMFTSSNLLCLVPLHEHYAKIFTNFSSHELVWEIMWNSFFHQFILFAHKCWMFKTCIKYL